MSEETKFEDSEKAKKLATQAELNHFQDRFGGRTPGKLTFIVLRRIKKSH